MLRFFASLGSWFRRHANRKIDVCDLRPGIYNLISSKDVQSFIGWNVYDKKNQVVRQGSEKVWTVLSRRALPNKFYLNRDRQIVTVN